MALHVVKIGGVAALGPARLPHYSHAAILIGVGVLVVIVIVIAVGSARSKRR
jgi:hypothetical protein